MKFIELCPKYIYYMGVIVHSAALGLLAFLISKSAVAQKFDQVTVLIIVSAILLYRFIFYTSKYIHATIDTNSKTLIFGNLYFKNEIALSQVKLHKKSRLFSRILKVKIDNRIYCISSIDDNFEGHFEVDSHSPTT